MDFTGLSKYVNEVSAEKIMEDIQNEGQTLKFFDAGTYTLTVVEANYHKNKTTDKIACAKDPSWFNVKVTLAAEDGRTKDVYLQIPTTKLTYNEANSKAPYFVFRKLCEFMASIGVELNADNVSEIIPAFFSGDTETLSTPEKIVGQQVKLDIGYSNNSIQRTTEGTYTAIMKGKPVLNDEGVAMEFADADAAQSAVYELKGPELQKFPDIMKYHAGEYIPQETKSAKTPW